MRSFNLQRAECNLSYQNCQNNFFQRRYILMIQDVSLHPGNVFKKLKHGSIIIGCWDIHWSVHLLFEQTSMDLSTCDKPTCYSLVGNPRTAGRRVSSTQALVALVIFLIELLSSVWTSVSISDYSFHNLLKQQSARNSSCTDKCRRTARQDGCLARAFYLRYSSRILFSWRNIITNELWAH